MLGSHEIVPDTLAEQLERLTHAQRESLAMELTAQGAGVEAMTTGELMLRFGKGLGANAVAMGALTALGFALPKKANEGLNVVMDAAAVAALVTGVDPAFAVVQGTMELRRRTGSSTTWRATGTTGTTSGSSGTARTGTPRSSSSTRNGKGVSASAGTTSTSSTAPTCRTRCCPTTRSSRTSSRNSACVT